MLSPPVVHSSGSFARFIGLVWSSGVFGFVDMAGITLSATVCSVAALRLPDTGERGLLLIDRISGAARLRPRTRHPPRKRCGSGRPLPRRHRTSPGHERAAWGRASETAGRASAPIADGVAGDGRLWRSGRISHQGYGEYQAP